MKILYIATSFPEPYKGSTIYTDLAEALCHAGHDITVVVSEQSRDIGKSRISNERGFNVLRIVTGRYYDVSYIEKGITTLIMPFLMKNGIARNLHDYKFDFILYESPPVTIASLVGWARKKYSCPSYLMLKDIFPQNAVDLEIIKKGSLLYKYFRLKELNLYNSASIIGCMSEGNLAYLKEHNTMINDEKLEIFPNTKRLSNNTENISTDFRDKHSIPKDACLFLFGGNMGKPQYIDLLCETLVRFRNDSTVFFIFVGRGTDRHKLEITIRKHEVQNAIVLTDLPRNEYEDITKECDVGMIILDPRFTIPNYPSRILSYMEFSKPVLAATDQISDLKKLIIDSKCGEWVWSGDKIAFYEKIESMSKNRDLRIMGRNGRKYCEENFSVQKSVLILENHFNTEKRIENV